VNGQYTQPLSGGFTVAYQGNSNTGTITNNNADSGEINQWIGSHPGFTITNASDFAPPGSSNNVKVNGSMMEDDAARVAAAHQAGNQQANAMRAQSDQDIWMATALNPAIYKVTTIPQIPIGGNPTRKIEYYNKPFVSSGYSSPVIAPNKPQLTAENNFSDGIQNTLFDMGQQANKTINYGMKIPGSYLNKALGKRKQELNHENIRKKTKRLIVDLKGIPMGGDMWLKSGSKVKSVRKSKN
jgi:hypothetical protein